MTSTSRGEHARTKDQLDRAERLDIVTQSREEIIKMRHDLAMIDARVKRRSRDLELALLLICACPVPRPRWTRAKAEMDEARWRWQLHHPGPRVRHHPEQRCRREHLLTRRVQGRRPAVAEWPTCPTSKSI